MQKSSNKSFEVIGSVKKKKALSSNSSSSINVQNTKSNHLSQSEFALQQRILAQQSVSHRSLAVKSDAFRGNTALSHPSVQQPIQNYQSNPAAAAAAIQQNLYQSSQPSDPLKPDLCSNVASNFTNSKNTEKSNRSSMISTSSLANQYESNQYSNHRTEGDESMSETELLKRCMAKISAKLEREKQKRRELKEMVKRSNANLGSLQQAVSSYKLDVNLVKELTVQTFRAVDSLESVRSTSRNPSSLKQLNQKQTSSLNKSHDRTTVTSAPKKQNLFQRRHSKSVSNLAVFEMMLDDSSSSDEEESMSFRFPNHQSPQQPQTAPIASLFHQNLLNSERKTKEHATPQQKHGQVRQKVNHKSMAQSATISAMQQPQIHQQQQQQQHQSVPKTISKLKFPSSHGIQSPQYVMNNLFEQQKALSSGKQASTELSNSSQLTSISNKKKNEHTSSRNEQTANTSPFVSNLIRAAATPQQIIAQKLLDFKNLKETFTKQMPELRNEITSGGLFLNNSMLDMSSVSNQQAMFPQSLSPNVANNISADKLSTRVLSIASVASNNNNKNNLNDRSNQPSKSKENSSNELTIPVVSQSINESHADLIGASNEFCCYSEIPSDSKKFNTMQLTASELINASSSLINVDAVSSSSKKHSRRSFESDSKEKTIRLSDSKVITHNESDRIEASMDLFKEQLNYFKMQDTMNKHHQSMQYHSLTEPTDRLSTLESRLYDSTIQRQLDKIYKIETPVSQHNSSPAESQNSSFAHSVSQCSTVPTASKKNASKKSSAQKEEQITTLNLEGGIVPTSLMFSSLVQQNQKEVFATAASTNSFVEGSNNLGDIAQSNKKIQQQQQQLLQQQQSVERKGSNITQNTTDTYIPPAKIQTLFYKTPAQKAAIATSGTTLINTRSTQGIHQHQNTQFLQQQQQQQQQQQLQQQQQQQLQHHQQQYGVENGMTAGGISDRSQCSDRLNGTDTFSSPMMNLKSPESINRFRESLKNYKITTESRTVKDSPSINESLGLSNNNQDGCGGGLVSMNLSESMAYSASIGSTPAKSNFYTTPNTNYLKSQSSVYAISSVAAKIDKSPNQVSTPFQNEKESKEESTDFITPQKKQR